MQISSYVNCRQEEKRDGDGEDGAVMGLMQPTNMPIVLTCSDIKLSWT